MRSRPLYEKLRNFTQATGTTVFVVLFFFGPSLMLGWRPEVPVFDYPEAPPRAVVYLQNIPDADLDAEVVDDLGEVEEEAAEEAEPAPSSPAPTPTPAPPAEAPPPEPVPVPEDAIVLVAPAEAPPEEPEEIPELQDDVVASLDDLLDDEDAEGNQEAQASDDEASPLSRAKKRKGRKARKKKSKAECQPDVPGVEALGNDQYTVERNIVDYYASHLMEAARLAYVVWAKDPAGDTIGFKVVRITCGSVLHEAGFKNGDIILSVNNRSVRSIPRALLAYRDLRKKRRLKVYIERRGVGPMVLEYRLL